MATFSERMKALRKEKDITLEELSEILGTTKATLSRYENNLRIPNVDFIDELANFFNVSTDYLLGRTDIKNPSDEISNAVEDDPELIEFWNELKEREDLQLLFKQTKNLSPKDIKQIIRIIKAIEDEEDMLDQ
ncbi:helix-turn-helix transcriptional regulator [Anaerosalibacter bizertensis]|uniref:Helix-turn-helix transcriptional regulator n=1 Tax=Anaerosalibacter bizertensis TaxID=932217 RepID=A0A844FJI3_9FIRM|nr:helix-turn-helix transcriptional regulator [Anaerosalibacter bizertensis]MSS44267.1 helix-turn-helix transcriptional regulator [Anaerosalibacter bizertensis]